MKSVKYSLKVPPQTQGAAPEYMPTSGVFTPSQGRLSLNTRLSDDTEGTGTHPGVPLVQSLHIDEGHFSVGTGHHAVVLAADDQVDVFAELPVTVPEARRQAMKEVDVPHTGPRQEVTSGVSPVGYRGHLTLVHIFLHKRVGVRELVALSALNKNKSWLNWCPAPQRLRSATVGAVRGSDPAHHA